MKIKIILEYFGFDEIEIENNSINLIVGKNNIGKIDKEVKKDKKNTEVYFLDLNLNPFENLKELSDFTKNKDSISPSSYFLIKEVFEEKFASSKISKNILSIINKELTFDIIKEDFEKPSFIIDQKENIDTSENAKILLKYLSELKINKDDNENKIIVPLATRTTLTNNNLIEE